MTGSHIKRGTFVCALTALALPYLAHAQTAPPPGTILKQTTPPPALPNVPGSVLTLPAPKQQQQQSATPIPVRRIVLVGHTLIPSAELEPLVQGLQGRTVTLGALQQAARRITALYQSRGYPLAHAFIPAQTVKDGIVRIQVVEPSYDRIDVSGSRLSAAQARRTLGLAPGDPIEQSSLDHGLLLLNRTPGVRVAGTLVPGAQSGTSTLQVKLDNAPVLHTRLHADDYGNTYTGRTRGGVDLSLDNPFHHGSQLALNTLTTTAGLLHAGGFSLTSPDLHRGLRAGAYGSRTLYRLGGRFAALKQHGRVNQIGVDMSYPLVLAPGRLLNLRLDALRNGFVQRSTTVGSDSRSHIRLARLSFNGAWADHLGGLTAGGLSISRGVLRMDSADARIADISGPNARGAFWVARLRLQREQPLTHQWRLRLTFNGQIASHALDGSEQFYLGGPYGVMSEPTNTIGGEAGALLDVRLSHPLPLNSPHRLRAALLLQRGTVWQRRIATTPPDSRSLTGAGLGLDYRYRHNVHASLAWVHPVGSSSSNHDGEWWARLTVDL